MDNLQEFLQQLILGLQQTNSEFMGSLQQTNNEVLNTVQQNAVEMHRSTLEAVQGMLNNQRAVYAGDGGDKYDSRFIGKIKQYDGDQDPKRVNGFLAALDLKFAMKKIENSEDKIMIFGSHLCDTAQVWFSQIVGTRFGGIGYDELVKKFKQRFLPVACADLYRDKLLKLKQKKSASEYIRDFTELMAMVEGPYRNEAYLMNQFLVGLKDELRIHLETKGVESLQEAFEVSQRIDNIIHKRTGEVYMPEVGMNSRFKDPDAMDVDELRAERSKTKSLEEIKRGNCFKCGQHGHIARNCKATGSKNGQA